MKTDTSGAEPSTSRAEWSLRGWGLAVAAATLALMIATEPHLAIVWDEGFTLGREARIRAWFRAIRDPARFAASWQAPNPETELVQQDRVFLKAPNPDETDTLGKLFSPRVLAWFWPFAREEPHGHPPFYAIEGLLGDIFVPSWEELPRARFGPMFAFSLTAGVLWTFVARRWGRWAASLSAGAWVFQPNLFANGHYATVDALLSCLWLLALVAFVGAVTTKAGDVAKGRSPRWGWVIVFGILVGWAMDSKLTGWFLPLPFFVWCALERSRRGFLTLVVGGVIAVVTLYAFNPGWWLAPIGGVQRFLESNLTRANTVPISVLFLGEIYDTPRESLPWYNTLVWTLLVTPVGFLAFALTGAWRVVRRPRSESIGLLAVGHWAFLLALRALPHTPGHDGVRQFLPAFGILAMVAGLGASVAIERLGRLGKVALVAALVEGALSVALMMPVPLSYFSPIVGGLPGASRLGMEPTYFWDGLTDETLTWLNRETPEGWKVMFATNHTGWEYLRDHRRLMRDYKPKDLGPWKWYVIQNRPGQYSTLDQGLLARATPAYVYRKWGVPLIWIFRFRDVEMLMRGGGAPL